MWKYSKGNKYHISSIPLPWELGDRVSILVDGRTVVIRIVDIVTDDMDRAHLTHEYRITEDGTNYITSCNVSTLNNKIVSLSITTDPKRW